MPKEGQPNFRTKPGTRYLADVSTYLNLPERTRNNPAAQTVFLAYSQCGPCTWSEAMSYLKHLPQHPKDGTARYWDARLKNLDAVIPENSEIGSQLQREDKRAKLGFWGYLRWRYMDRLAHRLALVRIEGRGIHIEKKGRMWARRDIMDSAHNIITEEIIRARREMGLLERED